MGIFSFLNRNVAENSNELPLIYEFPIVEDLFVQTDLLGTYEKILMDVVERTHGVPEKNKQIFWDNCLTSEAQKGLVSLLAEAMFKKQDLFLVYKVDVLRKATAQEQATITADYAKEGKSSTGVYVSFKNYRRTDLLKIYSALEFYAITSLHKSMNISKAVQVKIANLRSSVSLQDAEVAYRQMKNIAEALKSGKDVGLDKEDEITNATPDIAPTEKAISFLDGKRAYVLGLPLAYIVGEQSGGIGATGQADARAIDRGLKPYFNSIVKPTVDALLGTNVQYTGNDYAEISSALEVLDTFERVSDEYLSSESKREITARVFNLDPDEEKKRIEQEKKDAEKDEEKTAPDDAANVPAEDVPPSQVGNAPVPARRRAPPAFA